jgi:hypothetical protein
MAVALNKDIAISPIWVVGFMIKDIKIERRKDFGLPERTRRMAAASSLQHGNNVLSDVVSF